MLNIEVLFPYYLPKIGIGVSFIVAFSSLLIILSQNWLSLNNDWCWSIVLVDCATIRVSSA
jgi:hypothetical protein